MDMDFLLSENYESMKYYIFCDKIFVDGVQFCLLHFRDYQNSLI